MTGRRWFLILITLAACKRKLELLPPDAKNIARADSHEGEKGDVILREYKFTSPGADRKSHQFLCESREYDSAEAAARDAKKKIAERPQEKIGKGGGLFALSGNSLWLSREKSLVWCMLAEKSENPAQAIEPVRKLFLARLEESQ